MNNADYFNIFLILEVILLVVPALVMDMLSLKIRNYITFPFMLAGILTNLFFNGHTGLVYSLTGLFAAAGILIILYIPRYIGAGDVKFFSAIGAIMGLKFSLNCIIAAFLLGGLIGGIYLILKKKRFPFMAAAAPAVFIVLVFLK